MYSRDETITTQFGIINEAIKLLQQNQIYHGSLQKQVDNILAEKDAITSTRPGDLASGITHIGRDVHVNTLYVSGKESLIASGGITVGKYSQTEIEKFTAPKPRKGMILYNDTLDKFQFYNGQVWNSLGISQLLEDLAPKLGGDLDVNGNSIKTTHNGNINLDPNGSGSVIFKGNDIREGQFKLNCENNLHGVIIKGPPHTAEADYTLTLPHSVGTKDQVLKTNGEGHLAWTDHKPSEIGIYTTKERDDIQKPKGTLIFNSTDKELQLYTGQHWEKFVSKRKDELKAGDVKPIQIQYEQQFRKTQLHNLAMMALANLYNQHSLISLYALGFGVKRHQ